MDIFIYICPVSIPEFAFFHPCGSLVAVIKQSVRYTFRVASNVTYMNELNKTAYFSNHTEWQIPRFPPFLALKTLNATNISDVVVTTMDVVKADRLCVDSGMTD